MPHGTTLYKKPSSVAAERDYPQGVDHISVLLIQRPGECSPSQSMVHSATEESSLINTARSRRIGWGQVAPSETL